MLKLLDTDTSKNSVLFKIDQPVSIKGLFLHFSGLNGVTGVDMEELGRLKYRIRGKSIIDCDTQYMLAYDKIFFGYFPQTTTDSGLIDIGVYIPRWYGRMPSHNVEHLDRLDNAELEIIFGAGLSATSNPTTWVTELYADLHDGVESYHLTFHQFGEADVSASTVEISQYSEENILGVMVGEYTDDVVTKTGNWLGTTHANQGRLAYDIGHKHAEGTARAWVNGRSVDGIGDEDEQESPHCCMVYNAEGDDVNNKLFDGINMHFTNGSGGATDFETLICGAKINPFKMAETLARQRQIFTNHLERKNLQGHTQAVSVLNRMANKYAT